MLVLLLDAHFLRRKTGSNRRTPCLLYHKHHLPTVEMPLGHLRITPLHGHLSILVLSTVDKHIPVPLACPTQARHLVRPHLIFHSKFLSDMGVQCRGATHVPASDLNSFPAVQDLKAWCMQHALGETEYEGLLKLGFRVGDGHQLAGLEVSVWEWAGVAPLARARILSACQTTVSSCSN
jgi:hypothetical protein